MLIHLIGTLVLAVIPAAIAEPTTARSAAIMMGPRTAGGAGQT